MEPKVIITIVLIAFIIGGIIFLQVRNKKKYTYGAEEIFRPFSILRRQVMKDLKTIESRVRAILANNEEARDDDMILYLLYCNR